MSSCSEKKPTPREQSFDEGWLFHRGDIIEGERSDLDDSQWRLVNLPHDWSIENIPGTNSPFTADAITEVSGGFTVGGTGWYRKHFYVDTAEKGKCIVVAFDGIYMNADIWVNDRHVANHVYGYTAFELDITDYVRFGEKNLIAVRVKNEGNILPLDKNIKSIAVVGPNINDSIMMRGNYSGSPTHCITILQGLKNKLPNTRIISERGSEIDSDYLQIPQMHLVNHDGQKGFLAQYYAKPDFSGEIINTSHAEVINFRTEGGYGFGKDVPASDFSAKYSGTYVPDFTGTLCFSVRGDSYVLKVNNKKIGEYVPKELSFKYTPGMNLTEAQRREFTESMKGRRGSIYTLQVKEGETYQIALDYKSGKEGSVSHLSVDMYERKLAVFEELKEKIKDVEAIIYVGGITPTQEGEGHERAKIELPDVQKRFLKAMHETGKPVIYVNCSGSAIALADIDYAYDALLQAWYPGQEGGTAVADVLFGDYNPSGKLPVTFYKSTEQLPEFTDYSMENRTYRYFKGEPQYAFGYGLSYTDFEFGEALLSSSSIKAGEKVEITIPLTNVGKMDGAEVVQVYVKSLTNPDAPIKSLKGYVRQEIKAGKSEKVRITLEPESFAYYNADVDGLKVFPGKYQILYGNSSRDMDLSSLDLEVTPAVQ